MADVPDDELIAIEEYLESYADSEGISVGEIHYVPESEEYDAFYFDNDLDSERMTVDTREADIEFARQKVGETFVVQHEDFLLKRFFLYGLNMIFSPNCPGHKFCLVDMEKTNMYFGTTRGRFYFYEEEENKFYPFRRTDPHIIERNIREKPAKIVITMEKPDRVRKIIQESETSELSSPYVGEDEPRFARKPEVPTIMVQLKGYSVPLTPHNMSRRLKLHLNLYSLEEIALAASQSNVDPTDDSMSEWQYSSICSQLKENSSDIQYD